MKYRMDGAAVSRAASYVSKQLNNRAEMEACFKYEYLEQVPQPYRDMFLSIIEWQLRGGKEGDYIESPLPSFRQSGTEIAALYKSAADAKGISIRAVAVKAKVSPAKVIDFYAGRVIPIPALAKIKRAFKEFGIVFGV